MYCTPPLMSADIRWTIAQDTQSHWAHLQDARRAVQPTPAHDHIIARMDQIASEGDHDRTASGLIRNRRGRVGGEMMTAQVQVLGHETLIIMMSEGRRGHQRRILVDRRGVIWMDTGKGRAIRAAAKYAEPVQAILAARRVA